MAAATKEKWFQWNKGDNKENHAYSLTHKFESSDGVYSRPTSAFDELGELRNFFSFFSNTSF